LQQKLGASACAPPFLPELLALLLLVLLVLGSVK
jgi:hypothetical protein